MLPYVRTEAVKIRRPRFSSGMVETIDGQWVTPRIAADNSLYVVGFDNYGKRGFSIVDWVHFVDDVAKVGGTAGLTLVVAGRYEIGVTQIDGQDLQLGDKVEFPASVAKAFTPSIVSGLYRVVALNPVTIQVANPAIYALTDASEIGGAIYYQSDSTGALSGLGVVPLEVDGAINQTRAGYEVGTPAALIDGNINTSLSAANSSWHGAWYNVKPQGATDTTVDIVGMEFTIASYRQSYDTGASWATGEIKIYSGKNRTGSIINVVDGSESIYASTLAAHTGATWASSATGPVKFYRRTATPFTLSGIGVYDAPGSRGYYNDFRALSATANCQIKLKDGTIPESGSIITISTEVGKMFSPAIAAGSYPVLKNDNNGPWKLGPRIVLITAIGSAVNYGLYIDNNEYDENYDQTLLLECGTQYQLRINSPVAVDRCEYLYQYDGDITQLIGGSTNKGNNFSVFFTPTIEHYNASQAGTTAELWFDAEGDDTIELKKFPFRVRYTQRGKMLSPAETLTWNKNVAIPLEITTDPNRTYLGFTWQYFNGNGTENTQPVDVDGVKTGSLTALAAGTYRLKVTARYSGGALPNEVYYADLAIV